MVFMVMEGFTIEQQQYLKGFTSGIAAHRDLPFLGQNARGQFTNAPEESVEPTVYGTPVDELSKEESIKYEQNGLDCWDSLMSQAQKGEFAEGGDLFRFKFYGLFHVKPAQDSYMLRARIPGGQMTSAQFRGMAEVAEDWGGGFCDLTNRNNLQIREIMPENTIHVLNKIVNLGLTSRGSGADNVRNITATPTTGFDQQELIDVTPYALGMHHAILNNRDLYGLPRKFNIAFDSGGVISACADTNDIGFYAVELKEGEHGLDAGVYFRMQLCGITGHKQFASDSGVLLKPDEAIPVAAALMRVFIEHGNRTNRKKARLKYLVDDWGVQKLLDETQKKLAFPLCYLEEDACVKMKPKVKHSHLGVYEQKDGQYYVGLSIDEARMNSESMKLIAGLAERYGRGEIRLTVWKSLIIPGVAEEDLEALKKGIVDAGYYYSGTAISGGLIACTGNTGCKFAATNTRGQATEIKEYLDGKVELDQPINIHLTGCNHSCAQHYIGDIGMMGVKVKDEDGNSLEGYNIVLGGGVDDDQYVARDAFKSIPFEKVPPLIESLLNYYLTNRQGKETFAQFSRTMDLEAFQETQNKIAS